MSHTVCVQRAAVTAEACELLMVNVKTSIKKICGPGFGASRPSPFIFYILFRTSFWTVFHVLYMCGFFFWMFFFPNCSFFSIERAPFFVVCFFSPKKRTVALNVSVCQSSLTCTCAHHEAFPSCKRSVLTTSTNTQRGGSVDCLLNARPVCLRTDGFFFSF